MIEKEQNVRPNSRICCTKCASFQCTSYYSLSFCIGRNRYFIYLRFAQNVGLSLRLIHLSPASAVCKNKNAQNINNRIKTPIFSLTDIYFYYYDFILVQFCSTFVNPIIPNENCICSQTQQFTNKLESKIFRTLISCALVLCSDLCVCTDLCMNNICLGR